MAPKIRTNGVYVVDFAVAAPEEDELVKMQSTWVTPFFSP
jgi:hypothetical protein